MHGQQTNKKSKDKLVLISDTQILNEINIKNYLPLYHYVY